VNPLETWMQRELADALFKPCFLTNLKPVRGKAGSISVQIAAPCPAAHVASTVLVACLTSGKMEGSIKEKYCGND
jgi:hypothetical protein